MLKPIQGSPGPAVIYTFGCPGCGTPPPNAGAGGNWFHQAADVPIGPGPAALGSNVYQFIVPTSVCFGTFGLVDGGFSNTTYVVIPQGLVPASSYLGFQYTATLQVTCNH